VHGLTLGPMQCLPRAGVKLEGCDADHSPASNAEVKNSDSLIN
jgi:hypothetical protein